MGVVETIKTNVTSLSLPVQSLILVCVFVLLVAVVGAVAKPGNYGKPNTFVSGRLRHLIKSADGVLHDPDLHNMNETDRKARVMQAAAWVQAAQTIVKDRQMLKRITEKDTDELLANLKNQL